VIYYAEFGKELDGDLSEKFKNLEMIVIVSAGLKLTKDGLTYLSKSKMTPYLKQGFDEACSWQFYGHSKLIDEGMKKAATWYAELQ